VPAVITETEAVKSLGARPDPEVPLAGASDYAKEILEWLPCNLTLDVPIDKFSIAELLKLGRGSIVKTNWHHTNDIPLRANGQLIGWTEFEVVGNRLAVRITELA
jgi:flagellar motor switch/type III secretory pathway protein FliN